MGFNIASHFSLLSFSTSRLAEDVSEDWHAKGEIMECSESATETRSAQEYQTEESNAKLMQLLFPSHELWIRGGA